MTLYYIILKLIINPVLLRPNMNRIKPWGCCLLFCGSLGARAGHWGSTVYSTVELN